MNPDVGQPGQNPFMQMLQHLQSQGGGQPQAPNQNMAGIQAAMKNATTPPGATPPTPGGAPVGAGQASGLPGAAQPDIQDAAIPGQNPGTSKQLIGAMNLLHQAITGIGDPQEIQMLRSIIVLLTNLIQKDQQKQNQTTGASQQQGQPQGPGQAPGFPSPAA